VSNTVLLLLRHGATAANVCRPYVLQGRRPDSALVDEGLAQAQAAARALLGRPVVQVYCSPLRRARQTAGIVADALGVPLAVEAALVEADVGRWTGLSWEEVARRWPEEHRAFEEDPERHGYPGGENLAQVAERVLPAAGRLRGCHAGATIVVVGHGVVNRVLLAHWLGLPLRYARRVPQDNGGLSVIEFHGEAAKVRTVNAVGHLAQCGRGARPHAA
jgi:broad specificity phosphatase PhoE